MGRYINILLIVFLCSIVYSCSESHTVGLTYDDYIKYKENLKGVVPIYTYFVYDREDMVEVIGSCCGSVISSLMEFSIKDNDGRTIYTTIEDFSNISNGAFPSFHVGRLDLNKQYVFSLELKDITLRKPNGEVIPYGTIKLIQIKEFTLR